MTQNKARSRSDAGNRQGDIALLKQALAFDPSNDVKEKFTDMLDDLTADPETPDRWCLSEKQRSFVLEQIDQREPAYKNEFSAGLIPRGNDVPLPAVLQKLPKRPPGRM